MNEENELKVSLLTGGMDPHYAFGLLSGLIARPISVEVIGNDEMQDAEIMQNKCVSYRNLRGDQNPNAAIPKKAARVLNYYFKLMNYAAKTDARLFHILWLNKFTFFDRTLLNLYYKALGKKLVFTAHNVNAGERDGMDGLLNRVSLRVHYMLMDHVFVHTEKMKEQLVCEFGVHEQKVTVIPYGINNEIPKTKISSAAARKQLGLQPREKTILFFGNIAPYKGLDILIEACRELKKAGDPPRLIIAGKVKDKQWADYWVRIESMLKEHGLERSSIARIEYIPDEDIELYYKAADVLILPYRHIFQSGVLFLAYGFGLPVIVADVGSLKEEVIEGKTGFVCRREDPHDLARKIRLYFDSDLYKDLDINRRKIIEFANKKNSWRGIGETTRAIYGRLS